MQLKHKKYRDEEHVLFYERRGAARVFWLDKEEAQNELQVYMGEVQHVFS